jgi:triacylglycerol lipase
VRTTTHHVFLIPGFFGFVNFGRLVYFGHVREYLEDAFARERLRVEIHAARPGPTSSLSVRAAELLHTIDELAPSDAPLHLIGHSTGGLDARLLASPNVTLASDLDVEAAAKRVRSVVSIASPHHGTPLAVFFSSMLGQQLLRLLSLATITVLRRGRLPAAVFTRAARVLARIAIERGRPASAPLALLDHLERELVGNLEPEQQDLIAGFVRNIHGDQDLMPQLMPASMALFHAATADRPGVRYGCVTARAAPPRIGARVRLGLHPWTQMTYALYAWLHKRVGDGDGIVPLASQLHGEVLYEARADHLDLLGHFEDHDFAPPHVDWLNSGSGFDRPQFEALWSDVARFVARRA